jgi:hypothetical protein
MGDRVQAEIWVYPLDLATEAGTAKERAFRTALEEVVDGVEPDVDDAGVNYWLLEEVNYGTSTMENAKLGELATAAGLWYCHADEGHIEWGPHAELYVPTLGRRFGWDFTALSLPVLSAGVWESFDKADYPVIRARAYFYLAGLPLNEWAQVNDLKLGELLDEVLSATTEEPEPRDVEA